MKKYIAIFAILFAYSSEAYSQSEPPYGMSEIQAYSIFYENFRTGNYDMALQFGKWMLEKQPRTIEGVNRFNLATQYNRMINVYTEISKAQTDPSLRVAYIDTAIAIFDQAFETFSEDEIDYYTWHFNRGRFYQENQGQIRRGMDLAYEEYMKAYELDAERLTTAGDGYYIQILLANFVSKNDRESALSMIDTVEPFAGASLMRNIEEVRDGLFSDPVERIEFLEGRLAESPGDQALITEIASLHEGLGNRAEAIRYAEKLYEISKTFENAKRLADYAQSDAQYEVAIKYLQEAIELTNDNTQKRNLNLEISETYQNMGNLRSARQFARASSQLDRNWGQPYIRIATIYAAAVTQCTSGRQIERDDRIVYWLVLDYLDRARSADSSVASEVQRRYRTYEPVLPTTQDKFFRGWEEGDELQVGSNIAECYGWIGESTKVR